MATKYYLDQPGLERLVEYINNALGNKADVGEIPENVVVQSDLDDYALKSEIPAEMDLSGYATKVELEDYATDADLASLRNEVTGVYHFRGSVADIEALQAIEDPAEGDVYNIESTGMNAAWTGSIWDEFGTVVDLDPYMLNRGRPHLVGERRREFPCRGYHEPDCHAFRREFRQLFRAVQRRFHQRQGRKSEQGRRTGVHLCQRSLHSHPGHAVLPRHRRQPPELRHCGRPVQPGTGS